MQMKYLPLLLFLTACDMPRTRTIEVMGKEDAENRLAVQAARQCFPEKPMIGWDTYECHGVITRGAVTYVVCSVMIQCLEGK